MLHARLVREGFAVNVKVVARIYREEGLWLRRVRRKRVPRGVREGSRCPIAANQRRSLDFTHDSLANGRVFRTANLKDDCTRECPAIEVDLSLPAERVVAMLDRVARERGYPDMLVVDNGPELRSRAMEAWAGDHGVRLCFIDPGKPTQNAYIESLNGRFREECLNRHWFTSLGEAREIIEEWRIDCNSERPHSSLNYLTPEEFAAARPFDRAQRVPSPEPCGGPVSTPAAPDAPDHVRRNGGIAFRAGETSGSDGLTPQLGASDRRGGGVRPSGRTADRNGNVRGNRLGAPPAHGPPAVGSPTPRVPPPGGAVPVPP